MDGYDFPALSISMNTSKLIQDFGVGMLSKSLHMNEEMGENLEAIIDSAAMERSVNPAVGGNIDLSL